MRLADRNDEPRRRVDGLRGLLIAIGLSSMLWAGMLGAVSSLFNQ